MQPNTTGRKTTFTTTILVKNPPCGGNRAAAPGDLYVGRDEQTWKNSQISSADAAGRKGGVGRAAEEPG